MRMEIYPAISRHIRLLILVGLSWLEDYWEGRAEQPGEHRMLLEIMVGFQSRQRSKTRFCVAWRRHIPYELLVIGLVSGPFPLSHISRKRSSKNMRHFCGWKNTCSRVKACNDVTLLLPSDTSEVSHRGDTSHVVIAHRIQNSWCLRLDFDVPS